jgi:hypothetical protein
MVLGVALIRREEASEYTTPNVFSIQIAKGLFINSE